MIRILACLALIAACGTKAPPPTGTTSSSTSTTTSAPSTATAEEPLPPVTKVGDACKVSKDCSPLGGHHRCMRTSTGSFCHETPMKSCDAPACSCFSNDPCVANDLGTCTAYDKGIVVCSK